MCPACIAIILQQCTCILYHNYPVFGFALYHTQEEGLDQTILSTVFICDVQVRNYGHRHVIVTFYSLVYTCMTVLIIRYSFVSSDLSTGLFCGGHFHIFAKWNQIYSNGLMASYILYLDIHHLK